MSSLKVLWLYLISITLASPLVKRIVYNPPITYPAAGTVWQVGDKRTVTWDTSELPPGTNPGMVVLGFLTEDSLNLMIEEPLARGFRLEDAQVEVIIPQVPERDNYIVVLFGDSGNASPKFRIVGGPQPESATSISEVPVGASTTTPSSSPTQAATEGGVTPPQVVATTAVVQGAADVSDPTLTTTRAPAPSNPERAPAQVPTSFSSAHVIIPSKVLALGAAMMAVLFSQ